MDRTTQALRLGALLVALFFGYLFYQQGRAIGLMEGVQKTHDAWIAAAKAETMRKLEAAHEAWVRDQQRQAKETEGLMEKALTEPVRVEPVWEKIPAPLPVWLDMRDDLRAGDLRLAVVSSGLTKKAVDGPSVLSVRFFVMNLGGETRQLSGE